MQEHSALSSLARRFFSGTENEDAVQDVWLRLSERDIGLEAIKKPKAYLTRMVYNSVTEYFRKNKRNAVLNEELKSILVGEETVSTERILAGKQAISAVEKALNELPARTREIFLMSRIHGKTHREIAKNLSISEQTVHYHIRRTVDHLAPLRDIIYESPSP